MLFEQEPDSTPPLSAKHGDCLCRNNGQPDKDGFIFKSPSCPIHSTIMRNAPKPHALERGDWSIPEKRHNNPKMIVAH